MKAVKDKQILMAADFAGVTLKNAVKAHLEKKGWTVTDIGVQTEDEKNPEMYQYMEKEASRHVHIVEQEDDRVLRNIRGVIAENEKRKSKKKKENRLGYAFAPPQTQWYISS